MLNLINAYENYLTKVKQASANTVFSYMRDIRQYAQWLQQNGEVDVLEASQLNISMYLEHLQSEGRSAATVSRSLASLKNFYSYVVTTGFLETSPVTTQIHVDRGEKKLPSVLTGKEIERLLAQPACVDAKGYRDKAMLEVMYATGMRVSELISLDVDDINLELGIVKCNSSKKKPRFLGFFFRQILCHSIYSFIFPKHFCVVLLFNLDICKKLANICISKNKYIFIVFMAD